MRPLNYFSDKLASSTYLGEMPYNFNMNPEPGEAFRVFVERVDGSWKDLSEYIDSKVDNPISQYLKKGDKNVLVFKKTETVTGEERGWYSYSISEFPILEVVDSQLSFEETQNLGEGTHVKDGVIYNILNINGVLTNSLSAKGFNHPVEGVFHDGYALRAIPKN